MSGTHRMDQEGSISVPNAETRTFIGLLKIEAMPD
jgi:hypothetical protein